MGILLFACLTVAYSAPGHHTPSRSGYGSGAVGEGSGDLTSAPDFKLPSISGGEVSLSGFRGKWVFVNFWATWCAPCVLEMPMMNDLYHEFKNENFEMLAISIDTPSALDGVRRFVKKSGFDFTVLLDKDKQAQSAYGVFSIPKTFMVDPDGRVAAVAGGMREWNNQEMIKYLRDLMNEKPDKKPGKKSIGRKPVTKSGQTGVKPYISLTVPSPSAISPTR